MSFSPLKHMIANWKQYSTKEYYINVHESGHGAKDPHFPSPLKGLHNCESVFITTVICDCLEAEVGLTITASWIQITSD